MKYILYLFIIFLSYSLASSQEIIFEDDSLDHDDKYFDLDSLDVNDLDFDSDFAKDFYIDYGYFPSSSIWQFEWGILWGGYNIYNDVTNYTNTEFAPTQNPFFDDKPLTQNESHLRNMFNKTEEEKDLPETSHFSLGLDFTYTTPLPLILRGTIKYAEDDSYIYSQDWSKSFLNNKGKLVNFKEVSLLYLQEKKVTFSAGFDIPIWGGFSQMGDDLSMNSIYYFHFAYKKEFVFSSKINQFMMIANYTDQLAYSNGKNWQTQVKKDIKDIVNQERDYLTFMLGMTFRVQEFSIKYEMGYSMPLNTVFEDSGDWKQHQYDINFYLYVWPIMREIYKAF